jgi:hypothetical protein
MRILFGGITSGRTQATISFAASMLRLQVKLVSMDPALDVKCDIVFFENLNAALNVFASRPEYTHLATLDIEAGTSEEFAVRAVQSGHDAVLGIAPLPTGLDWERIAKRPVPTEPLAHAGMRYNVAPGKDLGKGYFSAVRRDKSRGHAAMVLSRAAMDKIVAMAPPTDLADGSKVYARQGIIDQGKIVHPDHAVMDAYEAGGGVVAVDLESPCSVVGPMAFAGCVGKRAMVR